jgi:predicted amidohydrolase YtcJ
MKTKTATETLTIFRAKRFITMDEALPEATAIAVVNDRIVCVGTENNMQAWTTNRNVVWDDSLKGKVVMPGFIDNHIHPFLGALLLPSEIIAPEAWRRPDGGICEAASNPKQYQERLKKWIDSRRAKDEWLISWGYQAHLHGPLNRSMLDAICNTTPIAIQQRSFHEAFFNTKALEVLGITEESLAEQTQANWHTGHFFETGLMFAMKKLMPNLMRKEWYYEGLRMLTQLCMQGGVTTIADQLFGAIDVEYELAALTSEIENKQLPMRVINIADARGFSHRATNTAPGGPNTSVPFSKAIVEIEKLQSRQTSRVKFSKAVKLFADGAMFSQLMQLNAPGYTDGHDGAWLMSPEVLADGVKTYWQAGYQIHVHVNGDAGMDSVLSALDAAQLVTPKFDHRFTVHHLGFHSAAQTKRLATLGAVASVNPYYIHALADDYSLLGLGSDRAAQIVRAGSMVRAGIAVSFHSDFPMAPVEPLFLAWCAATRQTKSGKVASPAEKLSLTETLKAITIDAAYALRLDHEIGSLVAGKKADFTVLESDPYEVGIDGLKDIAIWGTVFEGQVNQLAMPMASVHQAAKVKISRSLYRQVAQTCCATASDHCDAVRAVAQWARSAIISAQ